MIHPKDYGVHKSHCCILHGCKYGNENCPVVNQEITQTYLCEDCPDFFTPSNSVTVKVNKEYFLSLQKGIKRYYIFDNKKQDIQQGMIVKFEEDSKVPNKKVIIQVIENVFNGEEDLLPQNFSVASFYKNSYY